MRRYLYALLIAAPLLFALHASGGGANYDIDDLKKSIELANEAESPTKMDVESATRILAYFSSTKERWEHFLGKIRKGEKGAIVTALHLIEFAASKMQQELSFALQETLIEVPDVVLAASLTANSPLKWICGKPAYENYDLVEHLVDGRIDALTEMLAVMNSPDEAIKHLYSVDLRPVAEACLAMVRKTATIKKGSSRNRVGKNSP
jgi:hypothetical protein